MKHLKKTIFLLVLLIIGVYLKPIYGFYSHKEKLPMSPWGWLELQGHLPQNTELYDGRYQSVAAQSLKLLAQHQEEIQVPGITASIAIDNHRVWTGAIGWADIETQQPMTSATQFRIGSTSKALTSVGLAQLVKANLITLDTPLEDIYHDLPNPQWANMTPRQLASHMAGIPHYGENTQLSGLLTSIRLDRHFDDVHDAVSLFKDSDLLFKPGEQFEYSSLGTVLLSDVMQIRANMPYQQWMQGSVIDPLQLTNTATEQNVRDQTAHHLATFYWHPKATPTSLRVWREVDLSHRLAGGGWISTSEDLAKLGQSMLQEEFIPASIRNQFWSPQILNNGQVNPQNYAIGWRKGQLDLGTEMGLVDYYHHGGVSRGAQCFLVVVPAFQLSLAINTNVKTNRFHDFAKITTPIVKLFASQYIQLNQSVN